MDHHAPESPVLGVGGLLGEQGAMCVPVCASVC